jgi:predicted porin
MKKTLIAMAVLAASGASMAQVTMYGVVGSAYQNQKSTVVTAGNGVDTRADGIVDVGAIGGGRLGFRGTEDLGGGLKANFNLEAGVGTSNGFTTASTTAVGTHQPGQAAGQNQLFNRQSWVGLSGGFGALQLGRTSSPFTDVVGASDVFGGSGITTVNLDGALGGTRQSNGVFYTTPSMGGFVVKAMYALLDTGTSAVNGTAQTTANGLRVGYVAGPLAVHVGSGILDSTGVVGTTQAAGVTSRTDGQAIGFSYDFGAAKLFAGATKTKAQANVGVDSTVENTDSNIGVSVPVGALTLLGGLGRNSRTSIGTGTAAAGTEDVTATGTGADWVLGAYYNFSKRTVAYLKTGVFNKIDFGANLGTANANRIETSSTSIGIRHEF